MGSQQSGLVVEASPWPHQQQQSRWRELSHLAQGLKRNAIRILTTISSMRRWRCLGRPACEAEKLASSHASAYSLQRPASCNRAAVVKRMMTSVKTWMQPCVACKHSQARYVCCEQVHLMPSIAL